MFCHSHPERIAVSQCQACGRPICDECEVILKARRYCPACSRLDIPGIEFTPRRNIMLAVTLAFLVPGAGQVYNGQVRKGLAVFFTCWMVLPWLYGIYDAYCFAQLINRNKVSTSPSVEVLTVYLCGAVFILWLAVTQMRPFLSYTFIKEPRARARLTRMQEALQVFEQEQGRYPSDAEALYYANPVYSDAFICNQAEGGYEYSCVFSEIEYKIIATPVDGRYRRGLMLAPRGAVQSIRVNGDL